MYAFQPSPDYATPDGDFLFTSLASPFPAPWDTISPPADYTLARPWCALREMIPKPLVEYHSRLVSSRERPSLDHRKKQNMSTRFDPRRQRPKPATRARLCCVTSRHAAVILRDVLTNFGQRFQTHCMQQLVNTSASLFAYPGQWDQGAENLQSPTSCASKPGIPTTATRRGSRGHLIPIFSQQRAFLASIRNPLAGASHT